MPAGGTGLFRLGSFGRRNAAAGHMVEVVLQGKSTLYHVYKRPFVDFFLRTVRRSAFPVARTLTDRSAGLWMVHAGHIYRLHARVRRPSH